MLFSPFAAVNPNFFGGFDAEIVQARPLIEAGAVGIERQSASLESTLSVPAVLT
jgi:hypothetical protein